MPEEQEAFTAEPAPKKRGTPTISTERLEALCAEIGSPATAKALGVSPGSVRGWLRKGQMPLMVRFAIEGLGKEQERPVMVYFWAPYAEATAALTILDRLGFEGKILES